MKPSKAILFFTPLALVSAAAEKRSAIKTDGGDTWKPFETFPFSNTQRVLVDPDDQNTIYVSTFGGSVFKGPATGH